MPTSDRMRLDLLLAHSADGTVTKFFSLATAPLTALRSDARRHGAKEPIVKITDPYREQVVWDLAASPVHQPANGV